MRTKDLPPEPYLFIKSIAEQGYSMATAVADLIDNSIAAEATRVEFLVNYTSEPFKVFIVDNGSGMDEVEIVENMRFPSSDMGTERSQNDLGRFGLGLKTASFSQTRRFTLISRSNGGDYNGVTWDLERLKKYSKWSLEINTQKEIKERLIEYSQLRNSFLEDDKNFNPNTIIVWDGLYKVSRLEGDIEEKKLAFESELEEEILDHLSLVFHRNLQNQKLEIRINNLLVTPFDPFPRNIAIDLRTLSPKLKDYRKEIIKIQGFVLPARAIKEAREGFSIWTQKRRGLSDMEGIYVYRNDRLIFYGGWMKLTRKVPQLQLGRLMVEIGNQSDELFHLNVAKSNIKIPYGIKRAFLSVISEIKAETFLEFKNRITYELIEKQAKVGLIPVLKKMYTSNGIELSVNEDYPLYKELLSHIDKSKSRVLKFFIKGINREINRILILDELGNKSSEQNQNETLLEIEFFAELYKERGLSFTELKNNLNTIFANPSLVAMVVDKYK